MAPVPDGNREGPNRNDSHISDFETPQVNLDIETESSSSDDEFSPYSGYQLLSQDPETTEADGICENENIEDIPELDSTFQGGVEALGQQQTFSGLAENLPPAPNTAAEERRAVWNKPVSQNQQMDVDQVQQIKSAMANFKLPTPDWAKAIPEDRWKERLFQRLSPGASTVQDSLAADTCGNKVQKSCTNSAEEIITEKDLTDKTSGSEDNMTNKDNT